MAGILRQLMLAIFVSKADRPAAAAALDRRAAKTKAKVAAAAPADRAELVKQALATRRQKEHLWNELSAEQKEELMGSLDRGMRGKIAAMQASAKKAG